MVFNATYNPSLAGKEKRATMPYETDRQETLKVAEKTVPYGTTVTS